MHTFERAASGGNVAVVCIAETKDRTLPQIYAMLVHEAVHIWQGARVILGENHPGTETEAYAIQAYAQRLMEEYARRAGS